jgi:hypothetical protein
MVVVAVMAWKVDLWLPMESVPITTNVWVRTPLRRGLLDATLRDKVCQWFGAGLGFSPSTQISSTNKTDRMI